MAEAYLRHGLSPEQRAEFETHLVDCDECRNRVLLAEMFQTRNGRVKPSSASRAMAHDPFSGLEASPVESSEALPRDSTRRAAAT